MIIIYDRNDLVDQAKNKNVRELEVSDIRFSSQAVQLAHVVLYIDQQKGLMRVFKHRNKKTLDMKGVYDMNEMFDVIRDGIEFTNSLGKSILLPAGKKKRQ